MATRFYDDEFSSDVLAMLKKRDVLGQSNRAQFALLTYNLYTEVEETERRFEAERKENPLLETTPAEAWLAAELMAAIEGIRSRVEIKGSILSAALKRYFREALPGDDKNVTEQELCRTIRPYRDALKRILIDLYDRHKSLRGILRIPASASTVREAMSGRKPSSKREAIIVRGSQEGWRPERIAGELDRTQMKPRGPYQSYAEMLRKNPQNFYSLKSSIAKKYRA